MMVMMTMAVSVSSIASVTSISTVSTISISTMMVSVTSVTSITSRISSVETWSSESTTDQSNTNTDSTESKLALLTGGLFAGHFLVVDLGQVGGGRFKRTVGNQLLGLFNFSRSWSGGHGLIGQGLSFLLGHDFRWGISSWDLQQYVTILRHRNLVVFLGERDSRPGEGHQQHDVRRVHR
uniref:(northern house mosquito) hypothetical protein n=1 Tax=Culex pipiens TaxID=7175 RepID=A0A8D8GLA7_CULPI